jgi:hypothetical protein
MPKKVKVGMLSVLTGVVAVVAWYARPSTDADSAK